GREDAKFLEAERAVETARRKLDDQLVNASRDPLFADGVSLAKAWQKFRSGLETSAAGALRRVRDTNDAALAANKNYPKDCVLFKEIKARLDTVQASLSGLVEQLAGSGDTNELKFLDETCLATYAGSRAFAQRADLYVRAETLMGETPFTGTKLIGLRG